jgi:hypothetical protein
MCLKISFYVHFQSGRLHFVKKKSKPLYPNIYVSVVPARETEIFFAQPFCQDVSYAGSSSTPLYYTVT